jgi:hypothetical protein
MRWKVVSDNYEPEIALKRPPLIFFHLVVLRDVCVFLQGTSGVRDDSRVV